ncbi:MAG TPA: ABC transporter permease [Tepidisphaeraceae bacterium]|nr:ABC transporter permease [Tepidisphaeraceae bacterium]
MLQPAGDTTPPAPAGDVPLARRRRFVMPAWAGALFALIVLSAITAWKEPSFANLSNLNNILTQNSEIGVLAVGMTLVVILGGIDLSIGSLLALSGACGILVLGRASAAGASDAGAVLAGAGATLGIGLAAGVVNGLLITKGRLAPFIATLAALIGSRSVALWMADGANVTANGSDLFERLGEGIPVPGTNVSRNPRRVIPMQLSYVIFVWAAVAVVASVLLNRTKMGRYIVAIGSNERAARYSAIAVDRIKIATYALMGLLAGLAGLMTAARYQSINTANSGILNELFAIAAVVIGGTRMEGGRGSILGTVVGVLLIGVIRNIMVMWEVSSHMHGLVLGLIIIAAVLVQQFGARNRT